MNYLVEKKKQYTYLLVNSLSLPIFEGIKSIYNVSKNNSDSKEILKNFQTFLADISRWDEEKIKDVANQIIEKTNSKIQVKLDMLLKATMKANIVILSGHENINKDLYMNVDIDKFIHTIYIESAREFWNNPYLFYHKYEPIEIKRNQKDSIVIIKKSIEESIRRILPLEFILEKYLGENKAVNMNININHPVSEADQVNVQNMINQDLVNKPQQIPQQMPQQMPQQINMNGGDGNIDTRIKYLNNFIDENKLNDMNKNFINNNLENRIMNILDNNNIKLSNSDKYKSESSLLKNLSKEENNKEVNEVFSVEDKLNINVKNLIDRDLKDTDGKDSEKATTYNAEDNNNYREIFSNSIQKSDKSLDTKNTFVTGESINTKDTQEKENLKNKKKFFNNYLHI